MGNWLNGLYQYANSNGGDTSKEMSAAFRAGVEWGRKDMLQHAIILMQETHDLCVERNEQIDGYEMARELVQDWTHSNAPHEGPGGFSPGPLDAVVGPQR